MNTIQQFFAYLFGKVGHFWSDKELPLEIPFTFSREEINFYYDSAPQFGTFGIFFSGLFILAVILLIYLAFSHKKEIMEQTVLRYSFILFWVVVITCIITPQGFGGLRYVGHFYGAIIYVFALVFYFENSGVSWKNRLLKMVTTILLVIAIGNISPNFVVYKNSIKDYMSSDVKLKELAANTEGLQIALSTDGAFGMLLDLWDYGLMYQKNYILVPKEEMPPESVGWTCGWQIQFAYNQS